VLLEVLLYAAGLVVAADLRVDPFGDDPGAKRAPGLGGDPPVEDQRHRLRAANVEVVADELLEERPPGRGPVEHPGVGDLELTKGQLVDVAGTEVLAGQRGR
jgi:hypothetical protein